MCPAKLLLVDDNTAVLKAIAALLESKFDVLASFQNGAEALREVLSLGPDVVLLDISLGEYNGFEIARRLRLLGSKAKIVFLTMHTYPEFVHAARQIGADGYIFKSRIASDLVRAIEEVAAGNQFFPEM